MHITCLKLNELKKIKNLTNQQIYKDTGKSIQSIHYYSTGRIMKTDFALQLCETYRVSPNWFFGISEDSNEITPEHNQLIKELTAKLEFLNEQLEHAQNTIITQKIEIGNLKSKK